MSLTLPDHINLPPSTHRTNIAIAEVTLFSLILLIQLRTRYIQEYHYWNHKQRRRHFRCAVKAWGSLISFLAQIRIAGFAMSLAVKEPSRGVFVAGTILQSVGFSPLLLELTFILLRCGIDRNSAKVPRGSKYPRAVVLALQCARIPILAAIVLFIVGGCILEPACFKAGAVLLLAALVYLILISGYMGFQIYGNFFSRRERKSLVILFATLPFFVIRIFYLLLVQFGPQQFNPLIGDWRVMVGMGFFSELCIVAGLMGAGIMVEPIFGSVASIEVPSV
ncbi:hypothetical protein K402DRAFT_418832 [Aulographum hederae CBS 113979]|uniref:DUF7702 domain-containing protein n=1 Tax=Aulographum hederae CBS 113979 TaxID=1176131 RepID=A0A6G1H7G4_9PEZI|nr:hypothetical protein K402DRAFT_418832 [Aulographum hederae CBS 113979]